MALCNRRAFFMSKEVTLEGLLQAPYVKQLPPRGKLAFIYSHVIHDIDDIDNIPLEDAALLTGLNVSELDSWFRLFKKLAGKS